MDVTKLPFDTDKMLNGLKRWIECESPTHDAAAVNRMMDLAAYDLGWARHYRTDSRSNGFWWLFARSLSPTLTLVSLGS